MSHVLMLSRSGGGTRFHMYTFTNIVGSVQVWALLGTNSSDV